MLHHSVKNYKLSIKIRNKNNDDSLPSPNLSTSSSNVINSNKRFNEEQSNNYIAKDKQLINLTKKIKKIKLLKINKIQIKKHKNYNRSQSIFCLPMLSNKNNTIRAKNEFIIKKRFLPPKKNKIRALDINPVSLNLDSSFNGNQGTIKFKDPFIQRVNNYKQKLKNEFYAYKNKSCNNANNSTNKTQFYDEDIKKKYKKEFNKGYSYYLESMNKEVNNDLNILFTKVVIPKLYNHKSIFNV